MQHRFLLPFLFLPLLAPAQQGPPVNVRPGPLVRLRAADIPVDVAVINTSPQVRQPSIVVAMQGSDRLEFYYYFRGSVGVQVGNLFPAVNPLSILPLVRRPGASGYAVDDLVVLTADGSATVWSTNGSSHIAGTPLPLRGGLACVPTDRLLAGRFAPNSLGDDLLCWSDGPRPGLTSALGMARHLGNGVYQSFSGNGANLPPSSGGGIVIATASLNYLPTFGTDPEALFVAQPGNPVGECQLFENDNTTTGVVRNWWFSRSRTFAVPAPCLGVAVGPIDGRVPPGPMQDQSAPDCVFLSPGAITLRYGTGQGRSNDGYYLRPAVETYPVLFVPREVRLADLNGDQRPEMLVLGTNGTLNIFENTTLVPGRTMAFNSIPYVFNTGPDPTILRLGDLDGDGDQDIIVPCRGDNSVRLFLNDRIVLGAARQAAALGLAVYPTPATTALTVQWAAPGGSAAPATLVDALGRTVREWPALAPGTTLDVAGLPRGVYALRVQAAGGSATRRVVLE